MLENSYRWLHIAFADARKHVWKGIRSGRSGGKEKDKNKALSQSNSRGIEGIQHYYAELGATLRLLRGQAGPFS